MRQSNDLTCVGFTWLHPWGCICVTLTRTVMWCLHAQWICRGSEVDNSLDQWQTLCTTNLTTPTVLYKLAIEKSSFLKQQTLALGTFDHPKPLVGR